MKINNERGFTLLELMVGVAISSVLLYCVFLVMTMSETIFRSNDLFSQLDQGNMQVLRSINREISQTSPNAAPAHLVITTSGSNNIVRFQIPVDWDNDGDADTGGLNPQTEWGAYDNPGETSNGRLNAWVRYSVNSSNQLIREVLDSSLNTISGLSQVISNNVQTFTVTKSSSNVTMNLSLRASDNIGKKGSQVRNFDSTVNAKTLLRNAVS